ncbi:Dps family protein [Rhizohabitans arisaemae]|uniref:Dps family protein n=1 Tax=Rhizohabitans arisaemae TaxID=2720610 RepID=UPI0024B1F938|nr:DNA starvation/stationary phase protection protein [Rhizohabitans arisaemae]
MSVITSPLSEDARRVTGDALQGALTDLIGLSLLTKQAHWNVIGRHFRSLHLHFDEIVAIAREHADSVAERAITIGVNPDGRPATVAHNPKLPQLEAGYLDDGKVVTAMVEIVESIVGRMRERILVTEEPDPVTQDLLIEVTRDLEKQHWMLQAEQ